MIKYKTRDGKIIYGVEGEDFISSSTLEELYDDSMVGDNAPFSTNLLSAYYDDAVDDEERKYIENYAKMHPKFAKEIRDFRHMMNYSETDNRETADNYPYQNQEPFATNNYYNNQFESKGTNKKLIRLTEQDLHRIVKESVNKIIKEIIDAEPYEYDGYNPSDEEKKYYDVLKQYAKMPDGYDEDLDKGLDYDSIDDNNDEHWAITGALDKLVSLNKNDEAEMFPYLKKRQNDASWKALNGQKRAPDDPKLDRAWRTDNRIFADRYVRGGYNPQN